MGLFDWFRHPAATVEDEPSKDTTPTRTVEPDAHLAGLRVALEKQLIPAYDWGTGVVFYRTADWYPDEPCLLLASSDTVFDYVSFYYSDDSTITVNARETLLWDRPSDRDVLRGLYREEFRELKLRALLQPIADNYIGRGVTTPPPVMETTWTWFIYLVSGKHYEFVWTDEQSAKRSFENGHAAWTAYQQRPVLRSTQRPHHVTFSVVSDTNTHHSIALASVVSMQLSTGQRRKK